jgi:hypothetical protein
MTPDERTSVDRRAWLASCARHAVLGSLTVAAGMLVCRGQLSGCSQPSLACASCQALVHCELSRAAIARAQRAHKEHD